MTGNLITLFFSAVAPTILLILFLRMLNRVRLLRQRCAAMLQEKELIFGFVHDVAEVFADSDSVELSQMLKRVLFYALRTVRASSGAIFMVGADGETLRVAAVSGILPPLVPDAGMDLNQVSKSRTHRSAVEKPADSPRRGIGRRSGRFMVSYARGAGPLRLEPRRCAGRTGTPRRYQRH